MKITNNLTDNFNFTAGNNISNINGDSYEDMLPLFTFVEDYCKSLGGDTKWVDEALIIYHKDFYDFNNERLPQNAYVQFLEFINKNDSFNSEDDCIEVRFGDDIETSINSFVDIKNAIKSFITAKIPSEHYYTNEEIEIKNAKKVLADQEQKIVLGKRKVFEEKLVNLRISEDEFLDILDSYNQ